MSDVGISLIVNELELIVQTEALFLTIILLDTLRICNCSSEFTCIPVYLSNITLHDILLQDTDTDILLQVNVAVVNGEFESSTICIVKSLLRRVPDKDLILGRVPTLLVTSDTTGSRTVARLLIHRRLSVLRRLPNQTFQTYERRNQKSIVRSN